MSGAVRRWLVVHQNAELYGADRMLVEIASVLKSEGRVLVLLPVDGPLVAELRTAGVEVEIFPAVFVVRKATLHPRGWPRSAVEAIRSTWALRAKMRSWRASHIYVNTVTIPTPIVAARLSRLPCVVHVHEAETQVPALVRKALLIPLLLSGRIVVISEAVRRFVLASWPSLSSRLRVVRNPVRFPDPPFSALPAQRPNRLEVIAPGRWSPRKGTDLAVRACAAAARAGVPVHLTLLGSVYPGYEWFEDEVRALTSSLLPDTTFTPFLVDPDPLWRTAHVTAICSLVEPYGLVAAESLARGRITIASDVDGLREIVRQGETGWRCAPEVDALADGLIEIWRNWPEALRRAGLGIDAAEVWTRGAYAKELTAALDRV